MWINSPIMAEIIGETVTGGEEDDVDGLQCLRGSFDERIIQFWLCMKGQTGHLNSFGSAGGGAELEQGGKS